MSALDPLGAAIRAQVQAMHRALGELGMLTPPADVGAVSEAQAGQAAQNLERALTLAERPPSRAPADSALWHYAQALTYARLILGEAQRVEPRALSALTVLSVWAAEFRRESLGAETAEALGDQLDENPQAVRAALSSLSGARERGAFAAADAVFRAAGWALTDPEVSSVDLAYALTWGARLLDHPPSAAQA